MNFRLKKVDYDKLSFYEKRIHEMEQRIEAEEYGTEDYDRDMANLQYLREQNRLVKNEKKIDWGRYIGVGIAGVGIVVNALIALRGQNLTKATAELAYTNDENMVLNNKTIWNLRKDYQTTNVDVNKIKII